MDNTIKAFQQKDKRISFLSLFSTLTDYYKGTDKELADIVDLTEKLNSRLYIDYPFPEETEVQKATEKQIPMVCPQCKKKSLYHNKGISPKSNAPYENYKCSKCKYIQWVSSTYDQKKAQESKLDEMKQELPPEYGENY